MNYVSAQMCPDFLEMIDNKKMNEKYVPLLHDRKYVQGIIKYM